MRFEIAKAFEFDAAHWLPLVADGHKCKRMHGHTYRVEVVCAGELDARGMVVDYAEIEAAWEPLAQRLDHRVLNDVAGLGNPTSEVLADWIAVSLAVSLPSLARVRVYESSSTWCEVCRHADHEARGV